jgi:hypothetical protein
MSRRQTAPEHPNGGKSAEALFELKSAGLKSGLWVCALWMASYAKREKRGLLLDGKFLH